jgi:hypothetical protein
VLPDLNNFAAQLIAKLSTLVYLAVLPASAETCASLDDPVTVLKISSVPTGPFRPHLKFV